jgi:protein MPE1
VTLLISTPLCILTALGHWIQQCPTNADPNYDGRPRIKRTTGIPRSFLKTVEKPIPQANDDPTLNQSNPTSVMVNADGEYVVAVADQASWESYQKKASGVANKAEAPKGSKELQERGIECDMCHKLMRDAVKTPCCKKVNCEECIQNALLESDFVCPTCEAKEILLDSLVADADTRNKIVEYKKEKEAGTALAPPNKDQQQQQKPISPPVAPPAAPAAMRAAASASQRSPSFSKSATTTPIPSTANMVPATTAAKKRPAEDEIGPEVPRGPAAMRNQQMQQQQQQQQQQQFYPAPVAAQNPMYNAAAFQQQYPNHGQQAYGYGGMGMGGGFNGGYNNYGFQGNGFQQQQGYFQGGGYGYNPNAGFMPQQGFNKLPMNAGMGMGIGYNAAAAFQNQQKTVFSEPFPSEEDSPYMRKPVNPHRHMRGKRIRPSDYKAVGGEMMGGEMM